MTEPNRVRMILQIENDLIYFGLQTFNGEEYVGLSEKEFSEVLENLPADKVIHSFFAHLDASTARGIAATLNKAAECADGKPFEEIKGEIENMDHAGVTLMKSKTVNKSEFSGEYARQMTEAEKEFIDKLREMLSE